MKKLFISILTCVFALFALGTATFAWFSMNNTVTAKDMEIKIKSGSSFLLIAPSDNETVLTYTQIQNVHAVEASAVNVSAELFPVAHEAITNMSQADTASKWYYQYSNDPAKSLGNSEMPGLPVLTTPVAVPAADFDKYVLVNTFHLTVAEGGNAISDIKVGTVSITGAGGQDCVKVLVATATKAEEFYVAHTNGEDEIEAHLEGSEVLQAALNDESVMTVRIYVYWDGAEENVYTNNFAGLKDTSITVTFTGTVDEE